jgi:hypothetical protein
VSVWIIFYVGSGLELKRLEKGTIELPSGDFFPPARRARDRRFYWGGLGWRALPKGYESFRLKILAVSTAVPPPLTTGWIYIYIYIYVHISKQETI